MLCGDWTAATPSLADNIQTLAILDDVEISGAPPPFNSISADSLPTASP